MNEHQVLQLLSNVGIGEPKLSCDSLTRLYVITIAEMSDRVEHDDLMELLAFGSLLYKKAFQEYRMTAETTERPAQCMTP